ncbi:MULTISPECIES: hypothetical protein [Comamonas]|uniref:hypothetical protein n=1 Tax=Comamonas TaxID=283 RepID=UPI0006212C77|nr:MULTISPECIES: hypothetical protein [Comamonas]KKI16014.1 hypothetical protein XA67_01220 [Comamonas thiooxydans]MDH1251895.1 hypothetical protein [Comamonas thiooxydans]TYK74907.1 hypothetical protein FSY45_15280 [Comamonas sp. Z1]BCX50681.1 hypothetical protein CTYAZ2_02630 [Comamonas testosteroni]
MKTGGFDGEQAEYRQGNFGFAHEWLQEFKTLDEVLERLDALRAADPAHRYLCTLDDVSQCSYTSGHASQDERLYLDSPDDMDWEDPAQEQALTLASLQHRVAQLQRPELVQDWAQVCGTLLLAAEDVDALLQANRRPEVLLDEVVYVQCLPVPDDELMIAGQPNGYFSADWDSFQNRAVIRHLAAQYGYRFFGMGAAWMGFVRASLPDAVLVDRLIEDLRMLYGQGQDEVREHAGWAQLASVLLSRRTLMLGYAEGLAEGLGLDQPSSESTMKS